MVVQADPAKPRLVVGIVVDQLRTDYIEQLQSYFTEQGFNTLLRDGVYIRDVDFKVPGLDGVSATAMLVTGAYPAYNGIPAHQIADPTSAGASFRLPLASASGVISNDSFSAENLTLSTIADEFAIDGGGFGRIYSLASDPQQAVLLAGHAATGAAWINNTSGNWATSSYYGALPASLSSRNLRMPLSQRIDTMQWRPLATLRNVNYLPEWKKTTPFKYSFSRSDRDVYKKFAAAPLSNTEITDAAIELLQSQNLGKKPQASDMLNIAYTLAPYKYSSSPSSAELTDAYLRLDTQIGRLLNVIDRTVGRDNALIWISSTGYYDEAVVEDKKYRIPGGEFSVRRARSLLNSYLSARHGNAAYVDAIRDGQVFLNHKQLESLRLDPDAVIDDARSFLVKMSGVADALTLNDVLTSSNSEAAALRLGVDPRSSGDIFLHFAPGWEVHYDEQIPSYTKSIRESAVMTPAFILGADVPAHTIDTPVEAVAIAPTLAGSLRIRSPNGARSRAFSLK